MTLQARRIPFYIAIGFSSLLLFSIQPVMTKAILPTFGGTAGVWVTAMLFFQTMLLMGYLYSYLLTRFFSRSVQSIVHLALLLFSLFLPSGVLAIHLTNRYLNLAPVVDNLAAAFQRAATPVHSAADSDQQTVAADWALISGPTNELAKPPARLWTDDYSNLFQVLK